MDTGPSLHAVKLRKKTGVFWSVTIDPTRDAKLFDLAIDSDDISAQHNDEGRGGQTYVIQHALLFGNGRLKKTSSLFASKN